MKEIAKLKAKEERKAIESEVRILRAYYMYIPNIDSLSAFLTLPP